MNLLLIDPTVGTGDGLNTGLGWLAASVEQAGHGARVLDLVNRPAMAYDAEVALIRETVERLHPDLLGFCIHSITFAKVAQLCRDCARFFAGPMIIGGPQMAFEGGGVFAKIPEASFAVVGEAEDTLPELMSVLRDGVADLSGISGLIWKQAGQTVVNTPRIPRQDIDSLPHPDYRRHFGLIRLGAPYSVMTSRGCPYSCIFCNSHMSGRKWRTRDLEDVVRELEQAIATYDIREFMVQEPVFNLKPERVIEFCRLLREHGIRLPWFSPSGLRADRLTPESLAAMKEAGCTEIKIGVETLVPEIFPAVNKGTTLEKLLAACEMVRASGFPLRGSFIIGLPGDTYATAMENFRRARALNFASTDWSLLIPYPGTKAYDWVMAHGTMFHDYRSADQGAFQVADPTQVKLAFDTPEFPAQERIRAFTKISVRSGNYLFDRRAGKFRIAATLLAQILRHDPLRLPAHLLAIRRKLADQARRGPEKTDRYEFIPLSPF